jgi:probable HAF family extracellular repeat protein
MAAVNPWPRHAALVLERLEERCLLTYTVTDIGSFGGASYARAVNDAGQVAGYYYPTGSYLSRALLYSDGTLIDLDSASYSWASGINNLGQVVGMARVGNNNGDHMVVWQNGILTDLGTNGDTASSHAHAINDAGQITGTTKDLTWMAFLYSDGGFTDLGTLSGSRSFGTGINNAGQVVGNSTYEGGGNFNDHAFIWQDGVMTELSGFSGQNYYAQGINDVGQVIVLSNLNHAYIWNNGAVTDLGAGEPFGINNASQVVGYSAGSATLWDQGTVTNLNDVLSNGGGWQLLEARAINNVGQIVGYGKNPDGQTRGFLLTPDNPPVVHLDAVVQLSRQGSVATDTLFSCIDLRPEPADLLLTDVGTQHETATDTKRGMGAVSAHLAVTEAALTEDGLFQPILVPDLLFSGG